MYQLQNKQTNQKKRANPKQEDGTKESRALPPICFTSCFSLVDQTSRGVLFLISLSCVSLLSVVLASGLPCFCFLVDRRVRLDIDNGKKKKRGIEDKNMRGGEGVWQTGLEKLDSSPRLGKTLGLMATLLSMESIGFDFFF